MLGRQIATGRRRQHLEAGRIRLSKELMDTSKDPGAGVSQKDSPALVQSDFVRERLPGSHFFGAL